MLFKKGKGNQTMNQNPFHESINPDYLYQDPNISDYNNSSYRDYNSNNSSNSGYRNNSGYHNYNSASNQYPNVGMNTNYYDNRLIFEIKENRRRINNLAKRIVRLENYLRIRDTSDYSIIEDEEPNIREYPLS